MKYNKLENSVNFTVKQENIGLTMYYNSEDKDSLPENIPQDLTDSDIIKRFLYHSFIKNSMFTNKNEISTTNS